MFVLATNISSPFLFLEKKLIQALAIYMEEYVPESIPTIKHIAKSFMLPSVKI